MRSEYGCDIRRTGVSLLNARRLKLGVQVRHLRRFKRKLLFRLVDDDRGFVTLRQKDNHRIAPWHGGQFPSLRIVERQVDRLKGDQGWISLEHPLQTRLVYRDCTRQTTDRDP